MQRKPPIAFRSVELEPVIALRGDNANEIAKRDLTRYYRLLDQELAALDLTPDEWRTLRDAIHTGHLLDNPVPAELWAAMDRAAADERTDAGPAGALLAKLEPLTPGRIAALLDYAERWRP